MRSGVPDHLFRFLQSSAVKRRVGFFSSRCQAMPQDGQSRKDRTGTHSGKNRARGCGCENLVNPDFQPQPVAQRLQHLHTGRACADHDGVVVLHRLSHLFLQSVFCFSCTGDPASGPAAAFSRAGTRHSASTATGFRPRLHSLRIWSL